MKNLKYNEVNVVAGGSVDTASFTFSDCTTCIVAYTGSFDAVTVVLWQGTVIVWCDDDVYPLGNGTQSIACKTVEALKIQGASVTKGGTDKGNIYFS